MKKYFLIIILLFSQAVFSAEVNEQEYYTFLKQVKCVTCQNQSVGDSYAPMALVMRKEIYAQFEQGKTQEDVKLLLTQLYGESVFFAPKFNSKHIFIWLMPIVI